MKTYSLCYKFKKDAVKTVRNAVMFSVMSASVMATEISPDGSGRYIVITSGEITGTTTAMIDNNIIGISNGASVRINGDMTVNSRLSLIDGSNIVTVQGSNSSLTADKLTINATTAVEGQRLHPYAFIVRNNASANIDDLTVNLKVPHEFTSGDSVSRNVDGGFGIALGTEHFNSGTSAVTVRNATINISNTENSKLGGFYQNLPLFGNAKALHKGGQITGLYVGTKIDADTIYTSTGLSKILAQDISADKMASDYIIGAYVYGPKSKVILTDSDIKVVSKGENSSTLKIGNFENDGTSYKGEIVSNGKMKLDSTEAPNAPTILLVASDSKLDASAETASADIKSANSAVVFGVTDLVYKNAMGGFLAAFGGDLSRNKSAENQSVKLNNAVISTTSENATLIKAASKLNVSSLANSQAGLSWSNGDFITKGQFSLSGAKSLATAAKNGWLFEAENGSTLDVNINQKSKVEGQASKNTSGILNIELNDNANWTLVQKGRIGVRSAVNRINLKNNAVLDASKPLITTGADVDTEINAQQTALTTAEAILTEANIELTAAQAELATAEAMPDNTSARRRSKERAINAANIKITAANNKMAQATQNKTAAEKSLSDAQIIKTAVDNNAAAYFIKLTSNGTDNDGTLVNDNGVINLANSNFNDLLTIEGNYEGRNGILKVNTDWNSPGDDVDGIDSVSDLLVITGNASGNTTVKSIKADGTEDVIDGNIGSILEDLYKNSAVVVRVKGTDNGTESDLIGSTYKMRSTFTGEARTTGAGLLKLTSRLNVNNETEYFWTITQTNRPNTPNYDPVVPGYVITPKAGLELGYTILSTLHERRGENQVLVWDDCATCDEKAKNQTWGRIFSKHLEFKGKTRLGGESNIYGFQLGHDFTIKRTDEGGHRLTGVYMGYGTMKSVYSDRFDDQINTGKGKQHGWNLGLTQTRYASNGAYVDLVGQIGLLKNTFNARNGVETKQKGTTLALSMEVGRPYALSEYKVHEGIWLIEPQAQIVYQMLKLKDFNDDIKQIKGDNHHSLRGRVGVRLAYNTQAEGKLRTNSFYIIANILQDFSNAKAVKIGQDSIQETYAKTWAELGLGGQLPVGQASYIYVDARYERSLSGAKRDGYRGNIGFKYTWQ